MIPVLGSVLLYYIVIQSFDSNILLVDNRDYYTLGSALYQGIFGTLLFGESTINPVLWTMHIEFIGSYIVFAFCLIAGKNKGRPLVYILLILFFKNTYYLAFILGIIISNLVNLNYCILKNTISKTITLFFAIICGSFPNFAEALNTSNFKLYLYFNNIVNDYKICHIIGAALILIFILHCEKAKKILSNKYFLYLGNLSFSIYLTHLLVIVFFARRGFFNLLNINFNIGYNYTGLITLVFTLILTLIISYYFSLYFEPLSINFANYMYTKFFTENNSISSLEIELKNTLFTFKSKLMKNFNLIIKTLMLSLIVTYVFAFIYPINFLFFENKNYKLELDIIFPKNDSYQLLYANDEIEFNINNLISVDVNSDNNYQILEFNIPTHQLNEFRLDFGEFPGELKIRNMYLTKGSKKINIPLDDILKFKNNDIDKIHRYNNNISINSTNEDPFIICNVEKYIFPKYININFSNMIMFLITVYTLIYFNLKKSSIK